MTENCDDVNKAVLTLVTEWTARQESSMQQDIEGSTRSHGLLLLLCRRSRRSTALERVLDVWGQAVVPQQAQPPGIK